MSIKTLLKKKQAQFVLSGGEFEKDYKDRLKIRKLKDVVLQMQIKQTDTLDDCLESKDWTKWHKMEKEIQTLKQTITELERGLDTNLLFTLMVHNLA